MKKINKAQKWVLNNLHWLVVALTALVCAGFLIAGHTSEGGFVTLDGNDAKIEESTTQFIEDSQAALYRIMNEDAPTDEAVIKANDEPMGQGFYTTIDDVIGRRLADGNNDGGNGWQCSRYTGWLATGKWSYSSSHPDYGPVNGKDVAKWLVDNYDYKYIDVPVTGAIGSGGFNTLYGHTAMYLYSTGANTAMVNDANYVPLTVSTHNMNIDGWVWVVPGNYNPNPEPTPEPEPAPDPTASCKTIEVVKGDTMGAIMARCTGKIVWGQAMRDYADLWVSRRVKPGQTVLEGWNSPTGVGLFAGDLIEYTGD